MQDAATEEPAGSSQAEEPAQPPKQKSEPKGSLDESEVERRVQAALRSQAETARRRAEAEASQRAETELRELVQRANAGDYQAQQALLDKQLQSLSDRFKEQEVAGRLQDFAAQKWSEFASGFDLDPEDDEFYTVPAEQGFKGLTQVLLRRTASEPLVQAMLTNPAIKAAIKSQVDEAVGKAREAARKDGMARALGSKEAPRVDPATAGTGQAMTFDQIEDAYSKDPHNPELSRAYAQAARRKGISI